METRPALVRHIERGNFYRGRADQQRVQTKPRAQALTEEISGWAHHGDCNNPGGKRQFALSEALFLLHQLPHE